MSDQTVLREMRCALEAEQARMDGEASGYRWGFFFGALVASVIWSWLI